MHQDPDRALLISRPFALLPDADYLIRWRARSLVELDGEVTDEGAYSIGFAISQERFHQLSDDERGALTRTVQEISPAPRSTEWQQLEGVLRTGPHMDQLIFRISSGTGEWWIDQLEIRRLYSED